MDLPSGQRVGANVQARVPTPAAVSRSLDRLVAATPAARERTVDLVRAFSIAVVVIWHWALAVTHEQDGQFVMSNPIGQVPLAWLATWLLQVMPVFFLVGGFADLAAWDRAEGHPRTDTGTSTGPA